MFHWARRRGYQVAWGEPAVVEDVRRDLERRVRLGELEPSFYRRRLSWFGYLGGVDLGAVRSVIIVAVPKLGHRLVFDLGGERFAARVPPTYRSGRETYSGLTRSLRAGPLAGHGLARLPAPAKAIASRLGLVAYGRNNVTYTRATGSYHFLAAYATDFDLGVCPERPAEASGDRDVEAGTGGSHGLAAGGDPAPPFAVREGLDGHRRLSRCGTCRLCLDACPTGAITEGRFLIYAERCLAYLSEHGGEWPSWVPPRAHNCLVGCLICQEVCPENRGRLRFRDLEPAFTAAETDCLLSDPGLTGSAGRAVRAKLSRLGLPGYETSVGRNLRALMEASRLRGDGFWGPPNG